MVIAGKLNENNEIDIVMVEAGAKENTFEKIDEGSLAPSEEIVADGIDMSKDYILSLINSQKELVSMNDIPSVDWPLIEDYTDELKSKIETSCKDELNEIASIIDRSERSSRQNDCLLYTSPSPRDLQGSRMPSSA